MVQRARVLYPSTARYPDELELNFNNVITILPENGEAGSEWVYAEYRGQRGYVPRNYIELVDIQGVEVKVLSDFTPEQDNGQYLTLVESEYILLISYDPSGWDIAYKDHQIGAVPHNYFELLNPSSPEDVRDVIIEDLQVVRTLGTTVDAASCEPLGKDLTLLFEHHGEALSLLQTVIRDEVNHTLDEGTLFRKNNLCSYILTAYARYIGQSYLKETLCPLITHIATTNLSCEIDPHRITSKDEIEENMRQLRRLCQMFFHSIMESISKTPIALRYLCNLLKMEVIERFPKSARKVVGGFYFLRFICPAVVSPEGFGVIDKIDQKTRRALILISKIIQTLSNGVLFGQKEEYMIPMNSFINENLENVHFVLDKLAFPLREGNVPERLPSMLPDDYSNLLSRLHYQLYSAYPKLISALRLRLTSLADNTNLEDDERKVEKLMSVILRGGIPAKADPPSKPSSTPSPSPSSFSSPPPSSNPSSAPRKPAPVPPSDPSSTPPSKPDEKKEKKPKEKLDKKPKLKKAASAVNSNNNINNNNNSSSSSSPSHSPPLPEGSLLASSYILRKSKGSFGVQWIKRYYSIFSISTKIFVSNNVDEFNEEKFIGAIELMPAYNTTTVGRSKSPPGWEVRIVITNSAEINFIFLNENDMRSWIGVLDRRLSEILLPEQSLQKKENLLKTIQTKYDRSVSDLDSLKLKIQNCKTEEERNGEEKHLEELLATHLELKANLDKLKRERDLQVKSNSRSNLFA